MQINVIDLSRVLLYSQVVLPQSVGDVQFSLFTDVKHYRAALPNINAMHLLQVDVAIQVTRRNPEVAMFVNKY